MSEQLTTDPKTADSKTAAEQRTSVQHWIGGAWVGSARTHDSIDPATGEVIGTYADADRETGQAAIDAAARAFTGTQWRLDPMLRATALSHLADAYEARDGRGRRHAVPGERQARGRGRLRGALHRPSAAVRGRVWRCSPFGRVTDPLPGVQAMSIRQPMGVAGLIVPWNSPAYLSHPSPGARAGCGLHRRGEDAGAGGTDRRAHVRDPERRRRAARRGR